MSGPTPTPPQTFLQIVSACDNFTLRSPTDEKIIPWLLFPSLTSPAVGLLRPAIVAQLRQETTGAWEFGDDATSGSCEWVSFARDIVTPIARSHVMKELCERWRDTGLWPEEIGPRKWRAEVYAVYRDPFGLRDYPNVGEAEGDEDVLNYAFEMERAASGLFGIVTYGVHITVYEEVSGKDGEYNIWVARRSATKQTWPGYLDNSIAGGIPAGMGVFDCVVKESMEEGSVSEDIVRKYAKSVGSVSYFFRTPRGWLQPEVEYLYDICIPAGSEVQLKPMDGEVAGFELAPLSTVIDYIRTGLFKYNCAPVLVDFMVRKGVITPDNEPDYREIVARLHGRFDYDRWVKR